MTSPDINKIPFTVEVPKADVWVRNDYRDIVRRLGEVHMIRACEHQHDDDFVPLYDIETVAKYQVEAAAARRLATENHELAMLVRRLALALRKATPHLEDSAISDVAMGYLKRICLGGEKLRREVFRHQEQSDE